MRRVGSSGLLDATAWLERVRSDGLAAQLGGAAGTLGAFGVDGPALADDFARRLGLAQPTLPWHTNRVRVAEVGAALAALAGACGKIGRDITLLAQTEVGEVAEATGSGHGVSSTMPQKRNPVSSVLAVSCARGAAAASGVLTGSLVQEHQRAAGAWHAEWDALTSALLYAGGAAAAVRSALEGLEVFPARMEENIDRAGGVVFAEAVSFALGDRIGPAAAHALVGELSVRAAARGTESSRRAPRRPACDRCARPRRARGCTRPGRLARGGRRADRSRSRAARSCGGGEPVTSGPLPRRITVPDEEAR